MKDFLTKFKSVMANENSDLSKFDQAELTAESSAVIKDMIVSMKNSEASNEKILLLEAPVAEEVVELSLKEKVFSSVHTSIEVSRGGQRAGKRIISNCIITVPQDEKKTPLRKKHEIEFKE